MKKESNRLIFWVPRILSILFILFLMLFSLDIFDMNLGFWGTLLGLFMHNIPALFLIIIVIISWKHEIAGGIVFIMAGLLYLFMILREILRSYPHEWYMLYWCLIISGPAFLIGILFLMGWFKKKK